MLAEPVAAFALPSKPNHLCSMRSLSIALLSGKMQTSIIFDSPNSRRPSRLPPEISLFQEGAGGVPGSRPFAGQAESA
jgi:hypothetical protein